MAYKNPEDQAAASRRHYEKNRAKVIEASKQKRLANPEKNKEYQKNSYHKTSEIEGVSKGALHKRKHRELNPEKYKAINKKSKIKIRKSIPLNHYWKNYIDVLEFNKRYHMASILKSVKPELDNNSIKFQVPNNFQITEILGEKDLLKYLKLKLKNPDLKFCINTDNKIF